MDDDLLIDGVLAGDDAALRALMDRYDRLVRYTVFRASVNRCRQDPQFLDSVASDAWAGLVRSLQRRRERPQDLRAYLVQIARNCCVSALRRLKEMPATEDVAYSDTSLNTLQEIGPEDIVSRLELLEVLRECLAGLDSVDKHLISELGAITEKRWAAAASALGIPESTLRSRWKRTLDALRRCVESKAGKTIAPGALGSDF